MIDEISLKEILTAQRPPELREYIILQSHNELQRIEHSQKVLKKAKKEYIKIQRKMNKCKTTEDVEEALKEYPELLQSYDRFIMEDYEKMKEERKKHLEALEKQSKNDSDNKLELGGEQKSED
jgi:hypothetical protein